MNRRTMGNRAENALAELLQQHGWIGNPSRKSKFPALIMVGTNECVADDIPGIDDPDNCLYAACMIIECKSARSAGTAKKDLASLDVFAERELRKVLATYTRKGKEYRWKLERIE